MRVQAQGPSGEAYAVEAQMFVDATGRDTFLGGRFGLKHAGPF